MRRRRRVSPRPLSTASSAPSWAASSSTRTWAPARGCSSSSCAAWPRAPTACRRRHRRRGGAAGGAAAGGRRAAGNARRGRVPYQAAAPPPALASALSCPACPLARAGCGWSAQRSSRRRRMQLFASAVPQGGPWGQQGEPRGRQACGPAPRRQRVGGPPALRRGPARGSPGRHSRARCVREGVPCTRQGCARPRAAAPRRCGWRAAASWPARAASWWPPRAQRRAPAVLGALQGACECCRPQASPNTSAFICLVPDVCARQAARPPNVCCARYLHDMLLSPASGAPRPGLPRLRTAL